MAKTATLRIRLDPPDMERIEARAAEEHLPVATHVRRVLMQDCEEHDQPKETRAK